MSTNAMPVSAGRQAEQLREASSPPAERADADDGERRPLVGSAAATPDVRDFLRATRFFEAVDRVFDDDALALIGLPRCSVGVTRRQVAWLPRTRRVLVQAWRDFSPISVDAPRRDQCQRCGTNYDNQSSPTSKIPRERASDARQRRKPLTSPQRMTDGLRRRAAYRKYARVIPGAIVQVPDVFRAKGSCDGNCGPLPSFNLTFSRRRVCRRPRK